MSAVRRVPQHIPRPDYVEQGASKFQDGHVGRPGGGFWWNPQDSGRLGEDLDFWYFFFLEWNVYYV